MRIKTVFVSESTIEESDSTSGVNLGDHPGFSLALTRPAVRTFRRCDIEMNWLESTAYQHGEPKPKQEYVVKGIEFILISME